MINSCKGPSTLQAGFETLHGLNQFHTSTLKPVQQLKCYLKPLEAYPSGGFTGTGSRWNQLQGPSTLQAGFETFFAWTSSTRPHWNQFNNWNATWSRLKPTLQAVSLEPVPDETSFKAHLHYKLVLKPSWLEPVPHVHTETSSTIEMLPEAAWSLPFRWFHWNRFHMKPVSVWTHGTCSRDRWNQFQCVV